MIILHFSFMLADCKKVMDTWKDKTIIDVILILYYKEATHIILFRTRMLLENKLKFYLNWNASWKSERLWGAIH